MIIIDALLFAAILIILLGSLIGPVGGIFLLTDSLDDWLGCNHPATCTVFFAILAVAWLCGWYLMWETVFGWFPDPCGDLK